MRRYLIVLSILTVTLMTALASPGLGVRAAPEDAPRAQATTPGPLQLTQIEPSQVRNDSPQTMSLRGANFTDACVVRLVGYGYLSTTVLNATALTAQLPAGVPPGTYTVEVSDESGDSDSLPDALTVDSPPPPTATPKPPSEPPPGRPILTIRNYTIEPAQVKAGEEFVVTIEIYNNGSRAGENTMAVFPGGTFLPVGETGHLLWQLHINHTVSVSQRMRAPDTLPSGVHQLQVDLAANDWEGNHYDYPETIPVEVIGKPEPSDFTGQPKVVVEGAETDPPVLVPGETFSLTLRLANRGARTAVNVFATSSSSELAVPASGSDTVSTPKIGIEETVTVTLPLVLGAVDTGGRQNMAISLAYSDYNGGNYTNQQNIGVDINTSLTRQPQLIIEAYTTDPETLAAGDTFTLSLRLANVGGADASRLVIALGGKGGASLAPFIPLRSGNVIFVDEVPQGESVTVARQLIVDGSADPKAYNLPIALAYDDLRASRQEDVQRLSIIVRRRPELQVSFYRPPDRLMVGAMMPVALEVVNIGSSTINITELTGSSPTMETQVDGIPFVGPLDPGGSAPLDLVVTPQEPGPTELVVSVRYRDDFNQTQTITDTLEVEVVGGPQGPGGVEGPMGPEGPTGPGAEAPEPAEETAMQKVWQALRGFFGLGS